jgi:hypothetical protein
LRHTANTAESATLACTFLVLILGLGAGAEGEKAGVSGTAQLCLNYSIYITAAICIMVALYTLFFRLIGA